MSNVNTTTAYQFDDAGYYVGTCLVNQDKNGKWAIPSDSTLTVPCIQGGTFCKWDGSKWINETIPSTCAEAISAGFTCISNAPDRHNQQKKAIIENLVSADPENYKTVVNDSFVMSIEEIPEPTPEEQQQKEDEEKQQALDQAIDELIKEMATADLMGDEEWKAELREQYNALIEEE